MEFISTCCLIASPLQLPGTISGYSFLADVHMDSGRLARGFVSSLGAFWPAMQALVGEWVGGRSYD
jgi:hypothetical protein